MFVINKVTESIAQAIISSILTRGETKVYGR
jgi:hypothetical protein